MVINLRKGWEVLQDIHEVGEENGIFRADFDPTRFAIDCCVMAPWTPIRRLEHLQLTFAKTPYYGLELRQFNAAPWWYRNCFTVTENTGYATLTFTGVDYFADVYLNGEYLGSHEGYNTAFSFEVGHLLKTDEPNVLVVKVQAPWETDCIPDVPLGRIVAMRRNQMKGTYEHTDTFLPRDVNPIGIWNEVLLETHAGVSLKETPLVEAVLNDDLTQATVKAAYTLNNPGSLQKVEAEITLRKLGDRRAVTQWQDTVALCEAEHTLEQTFTVDNPALWTVWERGEAHRYTVTLRLVQEGKVLLEDTRPFGIRKVELIRTPEKTTFYLNNEPLYIRGTSYFPDVYISAMTTERYVRDLDAARMAGMNMLRVHVHQEKEEFYEMCDARGFLLIQDSDFNWVHPETEEWGQRALVMYREMLVRLRNHPSIGCWVCLNEPRRDSYMDVTPGPQMVALTKELDPHRPYIKNSWDAFGADSGDSHNYDGSLSGYHDHYTKIYGTTEKLNTEFGMDAPPRYDSLRRQPVLLEALGSVVDGIDSIQYYQYRFIKYFTEHYRIQKFAPCSGYGQFLFTDVAPTSFFGIYDWYGMPKYAHRVFGESNQPIGIFMELDKDGPIALWAVNDLLAAYPGAVATWQVVDDRQEVVADGQLVFDLAENGSHRLGDLSIAVDTERIYTVTLTLRAADGGLLAENVYDNAFNHPPHSLGHPFYMHHALGMRMYWAWMK